MKKKSENTKQYSLFKHETEVLEQINAVIKEQQDGNEQNPLLKDLQYMQRNYNKMFRNLKILTRLNDQQQSDLTSAKSKTEKLLNIQQTVTNIIQISLKPIAFKQQLSFILDEILSNQSFKLQGSGCIFLADQEDSTVFKMAVHKGIEDDIVLACSSIKSGVCLCGQSAKEKRFIFKNCVDDDHTIQSKYKKQHGHYIVPIVSGSNVLGILNLYLNEGHEENSNEQDFLWAVASTLAGVIERNQTEEELEASRKKLVALVDQLKEARNQAVIANETKSLFLANMSHEIRTPLTAILGFADTLLDEGLKKESRKLVTIILNNGNHLLTLVNDILDLSKIEANKLDIEKIPMDPCFLAKEIEMLLVGFAVKKGLTFKLEFKFPFPRQINSDPTRLKQIIINLCNNAIKFTEKGSIQLIVAYDAEKNVLNFSVIDSGIGLTADQQQRIFSAFEQADSSTTRKYGGTGLGLHVSLRLAEMLGGGIDVESVYGQGSCFNICVDAGEIASQQLIHHLDDMESTVIIKPSKLSIPMLKGHVLLAEDGIDNQKLIALLLEKVGLTVDVAENGQVAVEKVSTNSYDLVLMDMHMPVMDGIEATKQIVANNYDKPVIALTGGVTEDNINTLKNAGCRDILAKPIEKKKFYDVLKTYLKNVEKDSINHQKTPADKKLSGHVLVVEDNQQNLDLIAIFLKKLNLTHESAENGQIGVDKALSGDFDLVLMDMQMPIMSGVEATRILRQANYPKPIVACTANVSKSDLETYEKIGCDSLIAKPIIRKKFTKIIEDLLQNKPVDTDAINTVLRPDLSARLLVCDHRKELTHRLTEIYKPTKVIIDHCTATDEVVELMLSDDIDLVIIYYRMDGFEKTINMLQQLAFQGRVLAIVDGLDPAKLNDSKIQCCDDFLSISMSDQAIIERVENNCQTTKKEDDSHVADDDWDFDADFDDSSDAMDETIRILSEQFVKRLPQIVDQINNAIQLKDWTMLGVELHTLKGTAGNFGFNDLTEISKQAENYLKHKEFHKAMEQITELREKCIIISRDNPQ